MESVAKSMSDGFSDLVGAFRQNVPMFVMFGVLFVMILRLESSMKQAISDQEQATLRLEHKMDANIKGRTDADEVHAKRH